MKPTMKVECCIRNGHCAEVKQRNRMNQKSHVLCLLQSVHGAVGKTAYERNVGRRAVLPLAQLGERLWWMPLQPSNRRLGPLDSRIEQGRYLGPMDCFGTANGVVKARTIKRLPPGRTMDWQLVGRSTRQRIDTQCTGRRWRQSRDQSACVATTRGLNFGKCDERRCAKLTLSSLATQTIAMDVQMQEQVVNKLWIIHNSVAPAWKQSR